MDSGPSGNVAVITDGSVGMSVAVTESWGAENANTGANWQDNSHSVGRSHAPIKRFGISEESDCFFGSL